MQAHNDQPPVIIPLGRASRNLAAVVGGKAGPLGELTQAGFPVPAGFVITATAYRRIAAGDVATAITRALAGLGLGPTGPDTLQQAAAAIAAAFAATSIPDDLAAAIIAAYDALAPDAGPVAVRSSATAEDLPEASFAGQLRTFLNVRGHEALLTAVRDCWTGLWTAQAIAYRQQQGVPQEGVALAVLVQRMVPAEQAGVLFTADPVAGDRSALVVEAVAGLGERLVEGHARPERIVLGRATLAVRERSAPENGAAPLPAAVLRELGALAIGAEAVMGAPQDLEWATAGGKLWVVQSRPITTLAPTAPAHPLPRRFAEMLLERFPEPPLPLDYDLLVVPALGTMAVLPGNRLLPPPLQEEDGVVVGLMGWRRVLPQLPFRAAVIAAGCFVSPDDWERRYRPAAEASLRALAAADLAPMTDAEVVTFIERARRAFIEAIRPRWWAVGSVLPSLAVLYLLVALAVGRRAAAATVDDLVSGVEHITTAMNRDLNALAAAIQATPAAVQVLTAQPPEDAAAWLAASDAPAVAALWRRIRAVQQQYAGREVGGMSLTNPSWGDDPAYVVAALAALVHHRALRPPAPSLPDLSSVGETAGVRGNEGPGEVGRAARARARVLAGLERRSRLPSLRGWGKGPGLGGLLRPLFRGVLNRVRDGYRLREDSHYVVGSFLPQLRRGALELGRRWTARGLLDRPDAVFFLRLDELTGAAAGTLDVRRVVEERRRRWRAVRRTWTAQMPPPAFPSGPLPVTGAGKERTALRGTPASRGLVTGPIRIIRDQREFHRLRPGEVLVCPYTSPSWTPLFALAAAVVTETGGAMSHAAVVAREYGIPAVMAVTGALARLRDGQLVTVDGSRGLVIPADLS